VYLVVYFAARTSRPAGGEGLVSLRQSMTLQAGYQSPQQPRKHAKQDTQPRMEDLKHGVTCFIQELNHDSIGATVRILAKYDKTTRINLTG
jgi:hypothetical protein